MTQVFLRVATSKATLACKPMFSGCWFVDPVILPKQTYYCICFMSCQSLIKFISFKEPAPKQIPGSFAGLCWTNQPQSWLRGHRGSRWWNHSMRGATGGQPKNCCLWWSGLWKQPKQRYKLFLSKGGTKLLCYLPYSNLLQGTEKYPG